MIYYEKFLINFIQFFPELFKIPLLRPLEIKTTLILLPAFVCPKWFLEHESHNKGMKYS